MDNSDVKTYGLLGRNISYSVSPAMHNTAFKHFNIPARYEIFDVAEEEVEVFFDKVLSGDIAGFNVTVPYKIKTKKFLSSKGCQLDQWVEITGALNTVKKIGMDFKGYNTDVSGFYSSACLDLGIDLESGAGSSVFIAGAGGAGRAIALFLAHMNIEKVYVFDIDDVRLNSLQEVFDDIGGAERSKFCPVKISEEMMEGLKEADIIVNATPLGTHEGDPTPIPIEILSKDQAVYDLVYARETELLKGAKAKGLRCSNGLGMLVNQGALAFEIWTGKPFPEVKEIMKEAALEELAKR